MYTKIFKKCNPGKKHKILMVFNYMIIDMVSDKKPNSLVTEQIIRGRKRSILLVFITQSYFKVPKDVRVNSTNFILWKFQTKESLDQLQ